MSLWDLMEEAENNPTLSPTYDTEKERQQAEGKYEEALRKDAEFKGQYKIRCPHCREKVLAPEEEAPCPECGQIIVMGQIPDVSHRPASGKEEHEHFDDLAQPDWASDEEEW